jgi:hypothetical protein
MAKYEAELKEAEDQYSSEVMEYYCIMRRDREVALIVYPLLSHRVAEAMAAKGIPYRFMTIRYENILTVHVVGEWFFDIPITLENFQKIVDGYIEVVPFLPDTVIICNEEGKLRGMKPNFYLGSFPYGDLIMGTVIVCGVDGDEMTDCPISKWMWNQYLDKWGNY